MPSADTVASDGIGGGAPNVRLPGWAGHGHCLLDLRCLPPEHDDMLAEAVVRARHADILRLAEPA
ncbi:hypothetical protein ACVNF4_13635 [Streptomyces sp. S6]